MRRRKRSPSPQRRIRRSSGLLTCCSERSKYGTPVSQMASINPSVRSLGYRYSRRTRSVRSATARTSGTMDPAPSSSGTSLPYEARSWATSTISRGRQLVDLAQDRLDGAAALRAAERRDRAEPARPVAALGDLHVRPRRGGRRAGQVEQVQRRRLDRLHRDQRESTPAPSASARQRHAEPGDLVDLGQRGGQLGAVALGHAAGDDEPGAVATQLGEGEHGVDRLLPGRLDEGARVDDDEVGGAGVVSGLHPVGEQRADQLVRVDLVLRAAQRLDVEALGHGGPRYRRASRGSR